MTDEIIFERRGALGVVRLNRPKALNTLSLGMYRRFAPQLIAWGDDPAVHAVVLIGEGGRAGGDVRAIYDARHKPGSESADFFREEYSLIARVHRFPKPYIALTDGIVMGGGAGVSVNGSHRVATAKTLFAMPEVHIGLFPMSARRASSIGVRAVSAFILRSPVGVSAPPMPSIAVSPRTTCRVSSCRR